MKFKVGDKVKVLKHAPFTTTTTTSGSVPYSFNYGYIGDVGVIRYIDNSELPYEVEFVNDNKLWFKDNGALEFVAEKPPEHQKPSKSLDEKRYEWLKRYSMAGASIKEVEDAKTHARNGKEFDAVIDKYSVLIAFNKP